MARPFDHPVPRAYPGPPAMLALLAICCLPAGCQNAPRIQFPERLSEGYTMVLPGVLGKQIWDRNLCSGLAQAQVPSAIEVHDWTYGPLLMGVNLRGMEHKRSLAQGLANRIAEYQDCFPGRPVHIIGHSGGAGMAILTLEALPRDRKVTSAILLGAGLAPDYDLRLAMHRTEQGIHNFYSRYDLAISQAFVPLVGTLDGKHTLPAGAVGFEVPMTVAGTERTEYRRALAQHEYQFDQWSTGHLGGHFGWTSSAFVRQQVAPLLSATPGQPVFESVAARRKRIATLPQ